MNNDEPTMPLVRYSLAALATLALGAAAPATVRHRPPGPPPAVAQHVEILRTTHGVPHIRAESMEGFGYGLGYVMSEDYGARVVLGLLRGRGESARWFGRDSLEGDFANRMSYERAVAGWPTLDDDTRDVYTGFAEGVTRWAELHPEALPPGLDVRFTGYDALAYEVNVASPAQAARFLARLDPASRPTVRRGAAPEGETPEPQPLVGSDADVGSNAWALAPSRTKSGRAILLRNPHLQWNAGYYEAHVTVPGRLDYYGDFRVGSPFSVVGGFNRDLGFATTNNDPLLSQIYALDADTTKADHYLLDGASLPLQREEVTVEYADGQAVATETRGLWRTTLGPVVARKDGKIYVLRAAGDGDVRGGMQFLRMMQAHSLDEFKDAMRMRARVTSNFTYADRAGNIYYVWNGSVPVLPHPSGGDSVAVPATRTSDVWTRLIPYDSLPQVLNPKGGYLHNENDPPYYANMHAVLDSTRYPSYISRPRLGLRSQHAISLLDNNRKFSLEDVVKTKHSYRMLLAERVRDDLVTAVRASNPSGDVGRAIDLIAKWDGTVAPESKGGMLFEMWWRRYIQGARADTMYAEPWTPAKPTATPRGIRFTPRAVEAFTWAVGETARRYGAFDVAWGDVHRVRMGAGATAVDVPVGGCNGDIGCFRVLQYREQPDGKLAAAVGDGWVLAVEFGKDQPRAYSVLAYGESSDDASPWHSDQAAMFARGELKPVAWLPADVEKQTIKRYRPGVER
jgi:acyl-homoserine-lactone acylase